MTAYQLPQLIWGLQGHGVFFVTVTGGRQSRNFYILDKVKF